MHEDTVYLPARQKRLKDDNKNTAVLPKINQSDMAGTMEVIKEYLRSCGGVIRAPFAYVIRKNIVVETSSNYPEYATPDNEIIAMMLHLPPEKNKLLSHCDIKSVKVHTAEYKIDNRNVYDILDQICKDTDLYQFVKWY